METELEKGVYMDQQIYTLETSIPLGLGARSGTHA